jgi:uncharacterized protein YegP (UPF0339 family)
MATATKKARAITHVARASVGIFERAPMKVLIFEDNNGDYRWSIVSGSGTTLAQSGGFASYDDAECAASCVRDGAGSARFEPHRVEKRPLVAA